RRLAVVEGGGAGLEVDGDVVVDGVVVEEVVLDDLAFVAERDDELVDPACFEDLHDVPQDRLAAYFDHRLGPESRLFREPGTESACQDHCLHALTSADCCAPVTGRPETGAPKCASCSARKASIRRPCGSFTSS